MKPRELLRGFIFLLPIGRLTYTSAYSFSLRATPLGLGQLTPSVFVLLLWVSVARSLNLLKNVKWGVPAEDTSTLKSAKDVRHSVVRINGVPTSWNVRYLYYFNEFTLLGQISEVGRT